MWSVTPRRSIAFFLIQPIALSGDRAHHRSVATRNLECKSHHHLNIGVSDPFRNWRDGYHEHFFFRTQTRARDPSCQGSALSLCSDIIPSPCINPHVQRVQPGCEHQSGVQGWPLMFRRSADRSDHEHCVFFFRIPRRLS